MCPVTLEPQNYNIDFIIYYHIFSKPNYSFTLNQLHKELKQYDLNIDKDIITERIKEWVISGLVKEHLGYYTVSHR